MNWLNILAVLSLTAGIITGIVGLKSIRSRSHLRAEISWKQEPLSPWRYETLNMIVITIHSFGLICLAAILLSSLVKSWDVSVLPILESPDNPRFMSQVFGSVALAFTAFMSGVLIVFHFLQQWISPSSYGLSQGGLFYGGSLVHWNSFSHYETGPDDGLISLHSSYSPPIRTWVLHPPAELFASVLSLIQKNLPMNHPHDDQRIWQRSPAALIMMMSVLVVVGLLPPVWALMQNQPWVWGYAFLAFLIVQHLGASLIMLFEGRSKKAN